MKYKLSCMICGLQGDQAPPAVTGDPSNTLVAMQEHVVRNHGWEVGLSPEAIWTIGQHTERFVLGDEVYEWAINGVLWLHAEPAGEE